MDKRLLPVGLGALWLAREVMLRLREEDLRRKVVLITGGSRGLGFLLAREFGRAGCLVAICGRDEITLDQAQKKLTAEGIDVFTTPCDVSSSFEVTLMITNVIARFGRIDILVNNAGVIQIAPLENLSLDDFEEAVDIIYWGTVRPTLAVLPQMLAQQSGHIVNITSIGGKISVPHLLPYSSAKFAATGFSEGLRAELAPKGIKVTTIAPGLMRTGSYLNAFAKGDLKKEFVWFALSDNLPLISMDAERAARQIVQATRRNEAERVLSLPALFAAKVYALFPGPSIALAGLINRFLLPKPTADRREKVLGYDISRTMRSRPIRMLTTMGRSAARRFNQYAAFIHRVQPEIEITLVEEVWRD